MVNKPFAMKPRVFVLSDLNNLDGPYSVYRSANSYIVKHNDKNDKSVAQLYIGRRFSERFFHYLLWL